MDIEAIHTLLMLVTMIICGSCQQFNNNTDMPGIVTTDLQNNFYKCLLPSNFKLYLNLTDRNSIVFNLQQRHHTDTNGYDTDFLVKKLPRDTRKLLNKGIQTSVMYSSTGPSSHILVECQLSKKSSPRLTVSGLFVYNGLQYVVTSSERPEVYITSIGIPVYVHELSDVHVSNDYIISEKSRIHHIDKDRTSSSRFRRDVTHPGDVVTFTIDVLVVVDYSVYSKWLENAPGEYDAIKSTYSKREIHKYYRHVINGVDLRYQSIKFRDFQIRVRLAGISIMDKEASMDMSDAHAQDHVTNATNGMNADSSLKMFRTWMNNTEGLPNHDHAILFTGHDLYTINENEERVNHTSGLAFIGTLCNEIDSVSIVEEHGGFQSVGTAAHEIGHSLGSLHDGENNTCASEDRFIMAASGFGAVPEDKLYNPWFFSSCSVQYIRNYIASVLVDGSSCFLESTQNTLGTEEVSPEVEHGPLQTDLPGFHYTPDDQCRLIWGPNSYLCRGAEFGNASTICTAMYCRDPSTLNDCVLHTAARGTSCGNKKWCIQGQCVYANNAPTKQESCVLGDQPGPAFNDMTCVQLVTKSASYCYQDKVKARCCHSCGKVSVNVKGCEFGDRIQGCQQWHCTHVFKSRDIQSECCGTCRTGEALTTNARVSQAMSTVTTWSPLEWNDNTCIDSAMHFGMSCERFMQSRGAFVCYGHVTSKTCCKSCSKLRRKNTKGCEYGDRVPSLCAQISNMTSLSCEKFGKHCCESCVTPDISSTGADMNINTLVMVLMTLSILSQLR